ncbi:MAG: VTT domain-containing protein [Clostridiales bacterium]|nr:VTT domain-containing protein [Clostridiales bacterium]
MSNVVVKTKNAAALFLCKKIHDFKDALDEQTAEIKNVKSKRIMTIVTACVLITAVVVCYFTLGKKLVLFIEDRAAFKAWLGSFGKWGRIIFVAIRALQTVIKIIPGEPLEIAAGYAFGTWGGLFYCSFGTLLGSFVIIALTKKFGMKLVELFVPKKTINSMGFLQNKKNLNITLLIIYLIPSTPKDIITYLICLTDENIFVFLLITTFARIPSIITSTWCGSALQSENYLVAAAVFACTAACGIGGASIYAKISGKKKQHENENAQDSIELSELE